MKCRYLITSLLIGLMVLAVPVSAQAQLAPLDIDVCAPGFNDWDFTIKVVTCVQNSVQQAVIVMMDALSSYMTPVLGAMLTLATAIFAMRMMGGEQDMRQKMFGFAIRAGLIMFFSVNLGGYATSVFAIEQELITMVAGISPWTLIDQFLGQLLGIGEPPLDISKGIIGIIGASLLSSTAAGIMAFIAIAALINLLMFIFRVVFTYLTAIVMIGFLITISPLVIPMALFVQHTERFFIRWLDILIAAMLTPILLFAFLSVFMNGLSLLATDVISTLQCGESASAGGVCDIDPASLDFTAIEKFGVSTGSWLLPTDNELATKLKNEAGSERIGTPPIQPNIYSQARRTHQKISFNKPAVNYGPADVAVVQELIYLFIALWIFASFMKSLVERIPDLATNIAEASSYISMAPSQAEHTLGAGLRNVQSAATGQR